MVPLFGWIFVCICTALTAFEIYWDSSRRIYQQIEQDNSDSARRQQRFFPTWSWVRMDSQYLLCLLNIWISIITYGTKYFWVFISISVIILFLDMQLKCVKSNAIYMVCKYQTFPAAICVRIILILYTAAEVWI